VETAGGEATRESLAGVVAATTISLFTVSGNSLLRPACPEVNVGDGSASVKPAHQELDLSRKSGHLKKPVEG